VKVSGQLHKPTTLRPRKETAVPSGRKSVGRSKWCGPGWSRNVVQPLALSLISFSLRLLYPRQTASPVATGQKSLSTPEPVWSLWRREKMSYFWWEQNHVAAAAWSLYTGRASRAQRLPGRCEETNLWLLPEIEPRFFARPAHGLVTIPAEVTRLRPTNKNHCSIFCCGIQKENFDWKIPALWVINYISFGGRNIGRMVWGGPPWVHGNYLELYWNTTVGSHLKRILLWMLNSVTSERARLHVK
jgi:hypothetical protein